MQQERVRQERVPRDIRLTTYVDRPHSRARFVGLVIRVTPLVYGSPLVYGLVSLLARWCAPVYIGFTFLRSRGQ